MRIRVRESLRSNEWYSFKRWFAWRPVLVGEYWVWLQTIEWRARHGKGDTYRDYRLIED